MDSDKAINETRTKFFTAVDHFHEELKKIRTGRAHPSMLDGIVVKAYSTTMPLNRVASISAPEAQLLQVTPFDPNNLQAITGAIRDNPTLGLNPMDDGHVVRIPVPSLTEERRREYVKLLGTKAEDCMVSLRTIRHAAFSAVAQAKKDKLLSEDDAKRLEKSIDEAMQQAKSAVEAAEKAKESEIMTI
ncbi:MAG TPA: ribosome recycling factor [Candidatus Saccharimonadales bacterium]|nr:ribosome recycling factor [Candidatus Saccharimonadales bacterium]